MSTSRVPFTAAAALLGLMLTAMPTAVAQAPRLVIATSAEPSILDLTASRYPPGDYVTLRNVTEMLWGYAQDGRVVHTVSDWTVAPDHLSITFTLHPGIKFHSGDELVADDLKFSEARMNDRVAPFRRHGRLIDHVDVLDRYTARVVFKQPDYTFFDGVDFLLGSKAYYDRVGEQEFVTHPSGIGPYKVVDYKSGDHLDLAAFDGYYGPQPQVKAARFLFIKDDSTRVAMLRSGQVDLVMDTPYTDIAGLATAGFRIVKLPANPTVSLEMNARDESSPLHDLRVRQAIAHAIDGDAIVKGLFNGVPARYPRVAPGEDGYDPAMTNYSFDPALSKKLLAEAGYADGFKMPLYVPMGAFSGFRETAEAVALYLKQVGIAADVQGVDPIKMLNLKRAVQADPNQEFANLSGMPVANSGLPTLDMLTISYFSQAPSVLYKIPEVDSAITAALAEPDPGKRSRDVRTALEAIQANVASISLWDRVSAYGMKPAIGYAPIEHRMPMVLLSKVTVTR